jgi:esterase/lipase
MQSTSSCINKKVSIYTHYKNKNENCANYYLLINANQIKCKGILILIPGFNETPENVIEQTNIPVTAFKKGLLCVIPMVKTGKKSFAVDSISQSSLKEIIEEVFVKYAEVNTPVYIGGYSIGGSGAIKYAELANQLNYSIKPKAVFAIDPPLDFERVYKSYEKTLLYSKQNKVNEEANYMINRIVLEMKGNPHVAKKNYYEISPYSYTDSNKSAIKFLLKTPIRIYSEPDINWWIKERGYDIYNMNIIDAAAMINELNLLGNKNASLIISENKGYRNPYHQRHPHSWSIVDANRLFDWLKEQ